MKNILVVDDDRSIRRSLELHLSAEGFSVTTAVDGREAVDNALHTPLDLVLLDLRLPETLQLEEKVFENRLPLLVQSIQEVERAHIENILQYTGYEKKRTAEILNISRPILDARIRSYAIKLPD